MSSSAVDRTASKTVDLEVKDVRVIFTPIWDALEAEVGRDYSISLAVPPLGFVLLTQ
jgi:hypothetical protein